MAIFNVISYGADSSGVSDSTDAIQAAINACKENGGGEVSVPGGTYLIGDILLFDNITLHLESGAVLLGSRDPMDYFHYRKLFALPAEDIDDAPWSRQTITKDEAGVIRHRVCIPGCRWNNAMIRALYAKNIAVIGDEGSVIDGNDTYDCFGEENFRGPHGMTLFGCEGVTLRGYTIKRTGNWAHNTTGCKNLNMEDVTVLAGHDGIHMSMCENIVIRSCEFYTGDDCIAGFANVNVLVENCEISSACSAFRFGGTNVLVHDCHMFAPARYCFRGGMSDEDKAASAPSVTGEEAAKKGLRTNMLSAFTYYSDYSLKVAQQPGNIIIKDCRIEMADRFLHFNFSGNERWQANRPLADITFENIDAKDISMPLTAYGDTDERFRLTLKNIDLSVREGANMRALVHSCNCRTVIENLHLRGFDGDTLVRTWSEGDLVSIENVTGDVPKDTVKAATEPFFAKAI